MTTVRIGHRMVLYEEGVRPLANQRLTDSLSISGRQLRSLHLRDRLKKSIALEKVNAIIQSSELSLRNTTGISNCSSQVAELIMGVKILLADDSATVHRMAAWAVGAEFELLSVSSGDQAATKLDDFRPDLVIADALMPGKDGYELCQMIKERGETRSVPVVLLYGSFEPFNHGRAQQAGADAFLAKPFHPQVLVDLVKQLLARAATAGSVRLAPASTQGQAGAGLQTSAMSAESQAHSEAGRVLTQPTLESVNMIAGESGWRGGPGCPNHIDQHAVTQCINCRIWFCRFCLLILFGQPYCKNCKVRAVQDLPLIPQLAQPCREAISGLNFAIIGLFCFELCISLRVIASMTQWTDGAAVWVGLFCFGFFFAVKGIILAHRASVRLRDEELLWGHGRVRAALGLGSIDIAVGTVWLILQVLSLVTPK